MNHLVHYQNADVLIQHLDTIVPVMSDRVLASKYVGFLAISCAAVLESAIKSVFCDAANRKHKVLGNFCEVHFEKINGRIKVKDIKDDYLTRFGGKYLKRFSKRMEQLEKDTLRTRGVSIVHSYGNLITWRHSYAHGAVIPANATYNETKNGYDSGKEIIQCLYDSLLR